MTRHCTSGSAWKSRFCTVRSGRDALLWYDDDVEVFIAGPDAYWELQVNHLGTIYEVLHVWADATVEGGAWHVPEFDPRTRDARGFTGNVDPDRWDWDGSHPRRHRWSFLDWDLPGLRVDVSLDGTLNDDADVDRGCTVEIMIPWRGLAPILHGPRTNSLARPVEGAELRCCFARFRNLELNGRRILPTTGWALDPIGRYDIHTPERFSVVELSGSAVPSTL